MPWCLGTMKICMLSDYNGMADEGMRNIGFNLSNELARYHEVLHLCLRPLTNLLTPGFWRKIGDFSPQIIHFIPGSTIKTFAMVKALKIYYPKAKVVFSALHPVLTSISKRFVPLLKPDLVLIQSRESEEMFTHLGCETRWLLNGVDTNKFMPVSEEIKRQLRSKYKLDEKDTIVLHVGPIERARNVLFLNKVKQQENVQVLVIGSLSAPMEQRVYRRLLEGGCKVWRTYFENIAEIYALSDCYIFPTFNRRNAVEFPLSVMEAMSCNLPVLSTPFGELPKQFTAGNGLNFAHKEEDFIPLLHHIKDNDIQVKTREKVLPFSWENIATKLESIYREIC